MECDKKVQIEKDLFMQSNKKRWSFIRIIVVSPLLFLFIYKLYLSKDEIYLIAKSVSWVILSCSIGSFFGELIDKGIIEKFLSKKL